MKTIEQYSYYPEKCLGYGSTSKVYQGLNNESKMKVAIKVISSQKVKSSLQHSLLCNEVDALKLAYHPNIVYFYQAVFTNQNYYLISQFCPKGTLQNLIRTKGKLSQSEARPIFRHVASGAQAVHQSGILHRDLKPANIVLGEDNLWKITDFGFSKLDAAETKQKYVVGSPLYMAPQIYNERVYSVKSEVWALGVILYQMMFGSVPWQGDSQRKIKENINKYELQFSPRVDISDTAKDLILNMLQYTKQQRLDLDKVLSHPWLEQVSVPSQVASPGPQLSQFKKCYCMVDSSQVLPNRKQMLAILASFFKQLLSDSEKQRVKDDTLWLKQLITKSQPQLTEPSLKKPFLPAVRYLISNKMGEEASLLVNTFNYFTTKQALPFKKLSKRAVFGWLQKK